MFPFARGSAAEGGSVLAAEAPSTRRDRRISLPPGAGTVEVPSTIARPRALRAPLTRISATGVAFTIDTRPAWLARGTALGEVRLCFGDCELRGDIAVRDLRELGSGTVEVGGIFLPRDLETEGRLMALLAGIAVAGTG